MVRLLLNKNADVNAASNSGQTPLHIAALNRRQDEIIKLLLNHPLTNCNTRNSLGLKAEDVAKQMGVFYSLFKKF